MSRKKLYVLTNELESLGFKKKSNGIDNDPRDFWWEIDLSNNEDNPDYKIILFCDAYSDFTLEIAPIEFHLNFQTLEELQTFINVFKRENNHAFTGILDILSKS